MLRKRGTMTPIRRAVAAITIAAALALSSACGPDVDVPTFDGTAASTPPAVTPVAAAQSSAPVSCGPTTPATTTAPTTTPADPTTPAPTTTPTPTTSSASATPTTSVPPPTSTPPPVAATAAARFGWGAPVAAGSDEFDRAGAPDPAKWGTYNGPGHAGNGRRVAALNTVQDGYLRQSGRSNGDSAGMASRFGQKFGRWEVRARAAAAPGATGKPYHPVLITWPDSNQWPAGAEYDYFEVNVGDQCATAFLHYPNHRPKVQETARRCPVDITQWHAYALDWRPGLLVGYIDGVEWFRFSGTVANAPGPMHQTIQLDNFYGAGGLQAATFDADWARVYRP